MSSSDSFPTTYQSILELFAVHRKLFKCDYNKCDKRFAIQSLLDSHKHRKHAVKDITPREPIVSSTDAREQSTTAADDSQQQSMATTAVPPMVPTITSTSSPDNQSLDNPCDDDSDTDIEIVDTIPAVNTGQTLTPLRDQQMPNTSLVDNNQCLNINTNTGHTSADNPLPNTGQTVIDLDTDLEVIDTIPEPIRATTEPAPTAGHQTLSDQQLLNTSLVDHNPCLNTIKANTGHKSATDNPLSTTGEPVIHLPSIASDLDTDLEVIAVIPKASHRVTTESVPPTADRKTNRLIINVVELAASRIRKTRDLRTYRRTVVSNYTFYRSAHSSAFGSPAKPYGCPHDGCDKSFKTKLAMKIHRLSVHSSVGGRQYGYDSSTQTYYTKQALDKQRLTVHSAATRVNNVLQAPIETEVNVPFIPMDTTIADNKPVETTTALPVQSASASHPNNGLDSHLKVINTKPEPKSTTDIKPFTDHTAAAETLQTPIETIPMDTKVADDRLVEPTTALPVQSITATTDPNNSDLKPDLKVIVVKPEPKHTVDTKPPITDHKSDEKYIEICDTSSDENIGLEIVAEYRRHNCGQSLTGDKADGQCLPLAESKVTVSFDIKTMCETVTPAETPSALVSRTHPCDRCTQSFNTVDQLAEHKLMCRRCPKCDIMFANGFLRAHHMAAHHPRRKPPKWVRKAAKLVRKQTKPVPKTKPKLFRCKQCPMRYSSGVWFAKHMIRVHHQSRHKCRICPECKKWFPNDNQLYKHRVSVHSHSPYPCDQCDQSFKKRRQLIGHQYAVHSQPMPNPTKWTCSQCDRPFRNSRKLFRHNKSVHSMVQSMSMCETCGKGFVTSMGLADHKRAKKHFIVFFNI
ncbi:unnamed protein product [Medioppia subpectinata]|uniref:C2H2-type domain-containing protein n=1 Tax=Medioppia subpectinata TaxID=1979941 RepID=A0A7R9Q765_9ACAR|nr:unnamed protein product [Medioppia subpectinata]CAG2113989.1 unnamed protein product [Medioppia subpectinata]